jgi:hypothetical protein
MLAGSRKHTGLMEVAPPSSKLAGAHAVHASLGLEPNTQLPQLARLVL